MPSSAQAADHSAIRRLLEEGARSYLDAITALVTFQEAVQHQCREVLEKRLNCYSKAFGHPFKRDDIQKYLRPDKFSRQDRDASVGVKLEYGNVPHIGEWGAYCVLVFEPAKSAPYCWIGEWLPKERRTELLARFREHNDRVEGWEKNEIYLAASLKPEQFSSFATPLLELVDEWIRLWDKVGGIEQALASK